MGSQKNFTGGFIPGAENDFVTGSRFCDTPWDNAAEFAALVCAVCICAGMLYTVRQANSEAVHDLTDAWHDEKGKTEVLVGMEIEGNSADDVDIRSLLTEIKGLSQSMVRR